MLKKVLLGILAIVVVAIGGIAYFIKGQISPDHDSPDYRARVEFIWSGAIPYQPTAAEKAEIEANSNFLGRFVRRSMALPDDKPYLVAYPLTQSLSPAVIIAPGGAYAARSEKLEGTDVAQWLNSIGVSAFVLNYRLDRHPAPLSDAQRAIQYVRANAARFHIDPARVGIMGFSAGGHLASTAGTHFLPGDPQAVDPVARFSSRPDFMILSYPVITFGELTHSVSRAMLIGPDPTPGLIENLSNEKQVTAETPPSFIWTAKTDGVVDYRNSQMFADALAKQGIPFEFHLFPDGSHGSGLAQNEKDAKAWPELCRQWMQKMGFIKP